MNDPNKAISVNLSSLLSLKAELLRKQTEVNKAKATRTVSDEYTSAAKSNKVHKQQIHEPVIVEKQADGTTIYETDDSALLEKSKRVLEAKSKYYERMSRAGGTLNSDDNCLVLFNRKQQDTKPDGNLDILSSSTINKDENSDLSSIDSDSDKEETSKYEDMEDWVEYTDCLGRTRKCLKEDLENVKKRDVELADSMPERLDQSKPFWLIDTKGEKNKQKNVDDDDDETVIGPPPPTESIFSDGCSLMSKHDEQRVNWEKKELENLEKTEVHYQDVFFDEARQHGVGYYAFSTDEEERKKQQHELEDARLKTIDEQKRRDSLRAQREKIIAERVRAAKNRQRARLGLPPLPAEEIAKEKEQQNSEDKLVETKEERKARKKAEKLQRRREAEEAARELERQEYVRPWDKEKEGVKEKMNGKEIGGSTDNFVAEETEWTYKPERVPLSQEQWNEKKRAERQKEFAPVPESEPILKRTNFKSSANVEQYNLMPPPPPMPTSKNSLSNGESSFSSFQTTKKQRNFQRRNYESTNEADADKGDRNGAIIPPPDNLDSDYGLPSHAKRPKTNNELERSIEAGLRFLRNNSDKGTMSTKSSWTAKADY